MPRRTDRKTTVLTTSKVQLDGHGNSLTQAVLRRALGDSYTLREIDVTTEVLTHLDTADWRLRRGGIDLAFVPGSGQLVAHRGSSRVVQPAGSMAWPALISAIPEGPVRDLIQGEVWVRALLPFATSQDRCRSFAVLNEDAKTVARVRWRQGSVRAPVKRRLPIRLQVESLRGYAVDAATVERLLTTTTPLSATTDTWADAIWEAIPGLGPDATKRFGMQRDQAADLAVADALLGFLAEMEANVEGIVADIDTEYLHKFRVAVRRTRSLLKLLGDVLPDGLAQRMAKEFRRLGDVTSPTRDLDVYLLSIDELAQLVSRPAGLDAFDAHVRMRRSAEHRTLQRALRSARFVRLCADWRPDLAAVMSAPTRHRETAAQLADERLHRVFRKATKSAKAITRESPSEQVHSLRKTCKEMRYLLEVFEPLCNPQAYNDVITDFKELQGVLGDFQDGEVQAAALREFAKEMMAAGSVDADTLLAMGELSARFEGRQRRARDVLTKRHEKFLGKRAAAHVDRLLQG